MKNYNKQATDFLDKVGATLELRFIEFGKHFPSDTDERDIWEFRLKKGDREYTAKFGDSIANSKGKGNTEFGDAGTNNRPTAYSILSCLNAEEPADNVDDFAEVFGYTKPSEALSTFEAVQKEWQGLKELFSDEDIKLLQEIN